MLNNGYHLADDLKDICKSYKSGITIPLNKYDKDDEYLAYFLRIYRESNEITCTLQEKDEKTLEPRNLYTCEIGYLIDEPTAEVYRNMGFPIKSICKQDIYQIMEHIYYDNRIMDIDTIDYFDNFIDDILPKLIKSDSFPLLKKPFLPVLKINDDDFNMMIDCFKNRHSISKAHLFLSKYIQNVLGVVLRKYIHSIYQIDLESNGYKQITKDDILFKISEEINQAISDTDIRKSLEFIQYRLNPQYNIVRFGNCLYDMNKMAVIEQNVPVFTLIESDYNYNPHAKSTLIQKYLETSLKKDTPEETERTIQGVKELIGYLFTSGNRLNILPIITGVAGGGKSTFANIITSIFGQKKVADLKLQELVKNTHATSALLNKHLNLVKDSDDSAINNNSLIKQLTGDDSIDVNPKYRDPFTIPKNEVPKTIIACNNPPRFEKLETALLQRFIVIEFNVSFRNNPQQNPNLLDEILSNEEEMEWLIYESLSAYKKMIEGKRDFVLRQTENDTKELIVKHQRPVNYYLSQVIIDHDSKNNNSKVKYVNTNDLNHIILRLAEEDGVDIETNNDGIIPPRDLVQAIRDEFELDSSYKSKTHAGKRYYPNLIVSDKYLEIEKKISKY